MKRNTYRLKKNRSCLIRIQDLSSCRRICYIRPSAPETQTRFWFPYELNLTQQFLFLIFLWTKLFAGKSLVPYCNTLAMWVMVFKKKICEIIFLKFFQRFIKITIFWSFFALLVNKKQLCRKLSEALNLSYLKFLSDNTFYKQFFRLFLCL